jgi:hypothetical protein
VIGTINRDQLGLLNTGMRETDKSLAFVDFLTKISFNSCLQSVVLDIKGRSRIEKKRSFLALEKLCCTVCDYKERKLVTAEH